MTFSCSILIVSFTFTVIVFEFFPFRDARNKQALSLPGMLQHLDGSILKPVQPPPRGEREVNFYRKIFDPKCDDPVLLTLRPFLPKFLGMWNAPLPLQGALGT